MAPPILVEKNVLFVGVWRTPHITDELLKSVALQKGQLKGYPSKIQITTGGLMLYVLNSSGRTGRTDLIPIQTVYDITVNRHDPLCLLCVFCDSLKRINMLVCYCINDIDASHIVETFKQYKKSLSGEGFNFDLKRPEGKNWTLKTTTEETIQTKAKDNVINGNTMNRLDVTDNNKNTEIITENDVIMNDIVDSATLLEVDQVDTTVHGKKDQTGDFTISHRRPLFHTESSVDREELYHDGMIVYNVGVQTNGYSDEDDMGSTTSHSSAALRAELMTLSQEIRDIKLILEEATGISAAEYLRRHKLHEQNDYLRPQNSIWQRVHVDEKNNDPLLLETKPTNIANLPDHDARSYGTQTLPKSTKYTRKEKIHTGQSAGGTASAIRSRLKIDTSNHMYQNNNPITDRYGNIQYQQAPHPQQAYSSANVTEVTPVSTMNHIKATKSAKTEDPNNNENLKFVKSKTAMPASMRIKKESKRPATDKKYHSLKLNSLTIEKPIEEVYRFAYHPRKSRMSHRNTVLVYPSTVADWNYDHNAGYTVADSGFAVHAEVPNRHSSGFQRDVDIVEMEIRPTS